MKYKNEETLFYAQNLSEEDKLEFDGYVSWLREHRPKEYWSERREMIKMQIDKMIDDLNWKIQDAGSAFMSVSLRIEKDSKIAVDYTFFEDMEDVLP